MPVLRATALVHAPAGTVTGTLVDAMSRRASVVSVSDFSASAVLPPGPFRSGEVSGVCAQTAAGTLLTCSFSWEGGVFWFRRPVLALLDGLVSGVQARAEALADARVVVGAAVVRDGLLLAQQRAFPDSAAGKWELPGGRVDPGETDHEALVRECQEELGVTVDPGSQLGPDVILPNDKLLRIYRATMPADATPVAVEHKDVRWLAESELDGVDWLPADRVLLPVLHAFMGGSAR